ncbi:WxL domain-containing protein [Candidatus Enterococcus ferrettii]|uniref:WxL domain-containing protein n=1 Tax=Candidatus Enterococcus ferrettii TaxID=2815324 RepID=A0ABV0EVI6_9ENTE|nr:WxL domain-containing protein [Enterococcus sp. 665A]MBO1343018.1 WxL domain-containing protein [Enterococcus sp. 665A]
MNRKKLATALLGTAMMGGLLVQAMPAAAAPVGGGSTGGGVGFTGHTPTPLPNNELDLIWYPTAFEFGNSNANTTAAKTYNATNGATKYLVVRDNRAAIVAGGGTLATAGDTGEWKLTAKATALVDGTETLTGASYSFTGNALKSYVSASGQDDEVPESAGAITTASPGPAAVPTNISIPADAATEVEIMKTTAAATDGKYAAELNNIQLKVPANTSKDGKQYAGTIAWSLDDTI